MSIRLFHPIALACVLLVVSGAGHAQDIRTERVVFAAGASGTMIEGSITGREIVDYVARATAGQVLSVDMQASNASAYFNIMPTGADEGQEATAVGRDAGRGSISGRPQRPRAPGARCCAGPGCGEGGRTASGT